MHAWSWRGRRKEPSMNFLMLALLLASTAPAFAADKICVGQPGSDNLKGFELRVSFTRDRITVSPMLSNKGQEAFTGPYDSAKGKRVSKGASQISFEGYDEDEGVLWWADEALLKPGTSGNFEAHTRGSGDAGETDEYFTCHD